MSRWAGAAICALLLSSCGDPGAAPAPPTITRFAFDSGGAGHIEGHGAWRIEFRRHPQAGTMLVAVHEVFDNTQRFGPFQLAAAEAGALWKAVAAADVPGQKQVDRPGVPDEVRLRFVVEQGGRESFLLIWQNDVAAIPELAALLPRLRDLVETHTGERPVF